MKRIRIVPVWNPKPTIGLLAQALIALAREVEPPADDRSTNEKGDGRRG